MLFKSVVFTPTPGSLQRPPTNGSYGASQFKDLKEIAVNLLPQENRSNDEHNV